MMIAEFYKRKDSKDGYRNECKVCKNDIIRLNHYTNLQPLCSKVNRDIKRLDDVLYLEKIKTYCDKDVSSSIDFGLKIYK